MSAYVRQISINPSGNGGRVSGSWLQNGNPFSGTPALLQNDTLQVVIQVSGGTAPSALNGYMIIGPAPAVSQTQQDASPFLNGNKQICVQVYTGVTPTNNVYTFGPALTAPNPGKNRRQFELTFVAVDPTGGNQWEEDPEFDTGT
jgi:hypothetical protein